MNRNMSVLESLQHCSLFEGISEDGMRSILVLSDCTIREYAKGEIIAIEGEECGKLGIVGFGSVQVQKTYASGKTVVLATLGQGSVFGEAVMFGKTHLYPATIVAVADTQAVFISKKGVKDICKRSSRFLENFLGELSGKILTLNRKAKILSYRTIRERITHIILEQCNRQGKTTIMLPFSRKEMAEYLGIPRPSLSRELIAMKNEGLIDYHMNTIKIFDLDGLIDTL